MANIKIYNHKIFDISKNAYIEEFESFIGTLSPTYDGEIQYQKIDLDITIKLDLDQDYQYNAIGNYARLEMQSKVFYFFITNADWISSNCVMLSLSMDTINTYPDWINDFSDKTTVTREHKNRFQSVDNVYSENYTLIKFAGAEIDKDYDFTIKLERSNYAVDINLVTLNIVGQGYTATVNSTEVKKISHNEGWNLVLNVHVKANITPYSLICYVTYRTTRLQRLIDRQDEGITPILYNTPGDEKTILNNDDDKKWYLIYMSDPDVENAVRCFICSDLDIVCDVGTPENVIAPKDLDYNKIYRAYDESGGNTLTFTSDAGTVYNAADNDYAPMFFYKIDANKIAVTTAVRAASGGTYYYAFPSWETTQFLHLTQGSVSRLKVYNLIPGSQSTSYDSLLPIDVAGGYYSVDNITKIDRTNNNLIKIIELPYCPFTEEITDGIYKLDSSKYKFADNMIELKDLNTTFENKFNIGKDIIHNCYLTRYPTVGEGRNAYFESKLYNSSFFYDKFVYDSFNHVFALENIDPSESLQGINMTFKPTNTINSRFIFAFDTWLNDSTQDYDNIVSVSRNNEITLYNSEYINYIKNGYNYDKKVKDRQATQNWLNVAANIGGAVISGIASLGTGGLSLAATAMFAVNAVTQLTNAISTTINNEAAIQNKLDNYRNQATTVAGSDDIDLLNYYTNDNKAKLVEYFPSNNVHKLLEDLFYYTGYSCNEQKVPNIDNRYWFNYVQCDAVFNNMNKYAIYADDIKARLKTGVTIYHCNNGEYDFNQTHENPEV